MIFVFIALATSILAGSIGQTDYMQDLYPGVSYEMYCIYQALPHILAGATGLKLINICVGKEYYFSAVIIGILATCMLVTAVSNILIAVPQLEATLIAWSLSTWNPTYHNIEVLIALLVGINGLVSLVHMDPCTRDGYSDIMFNNHSNH